MLGSLPLDMVLTAGLGVGALMSWLAVAFMRRGRRWSRQGSGPTTSTT